jgi:hypothetical protein
MSDPVRPRSGVCDVQILRGTAARADAVPDLVLEVAHGATTARHFDDLRARLAGAYADDLREFFFVNTDVGAPEVAMAVAQRVVARQPKRTALIVRCLLPRTFVDCNRVIDPNAEPRASAAGEPTPGLPPWIVDARDQRLLRGLHREYQEVVDAAFARVCGQGGIGLCVHTYAPRSLDVAVDGDIVRTLRAEYAPDRIGRWPLRSAVDLITHDPEGRELASVALAQRAEAEFAAAGFGVARNGAYSLHPVTIAHAFASRHPGTTLCLEIRRDLLLDEFVPFVPLTPRPDLVEKAAAPLAAAVLQTLARV